MTNNEKRAMQQELLLFPPKASKGDILDVDSHVLNVRTIKKIFGWLGEALENHKMITGLAMLVCIPLLAIIALCNIHNPLIVGPVVGVIGGLFGVHVYKWSRLRKNDYPQ